MSLNPLSKPRIGSLGQRRPGLGTILAVFIVLAGILVMVAILAASGLTGLF